MDDNEFVKQAAYSLREDAKNTNRYFTIAQVINNLDSHRSPLIKEIYKDLGKKGYQGLIDLYDQGDYTKDPIIIFNRKNVLQTKIEDLDGIEYKQLYRTVERYLQSESLLKTKMKDIVN